MKLSFYFIIWYIFKYNHIQNNSEWSLFLGLDPLMWQCIQSADSVRFSNSGAMVWIQKAPRQSTLHLETSGWLTVYLQSPALSLQHSRHSGDSGMHGWKAEMIHHWCCCHSKARWPSLRQSQRTISTIANSFLIRNGLHSQIPRYCSPFSYMGILHNMYVSEQFLGL